MHEITKQAIEVLTPLLLTLLTLAVTFAIQWLRSKVKSSLTGEALAALTAIAGVCVATAAQRYVKHLKEAEDAKWDAAIAAKIKAEVVDDLKLLGAQSVGVLVTNGMSEDALKKLLDHLVESQVHELKVRTGGV